jgi:hypothetical protein
MPGYFEVTVLDEAASIALPKEAAQHAVAVSCWESVTCGSAVALAGSGATSSRVPRVSRTTCRASSMVTCSEHDPSDGLGRRRREHLVSPGRIYQRGRYRAGPCQATDEEGPRVAPRTTRPAGRLMLMMKAGLLSLGLSFKRLTEFGFPRRFPIVQFPNLPLIVAFLAGGAGTFLDGSADSYAASVSYLALTIWAYEELVHGVNWFRRLLGLAFVILLIVRVAHAVHA